MDKIVNMNILGNPINWLFVVLVGFFGAYAAFGLFSNLPHIPSLGD